MSPAFSIAVNQGFVPAAIAAGVALALSFLPRRIATDRHSVVFACSTAFIIGYMLLPGSWSPLIPGRYWQWGHWLAVLALACGPSAVAPRVNRLERLVAFVALALVAAWLWTPTFPGLASVRHWYVVIAAASLAALQWGLAELSLPTRKFQRPLLTQMMVAASLVAVSIVWQAHSLKAGQIATMAAGALGGAWAAAMLRRNVAMSLAGATSFYALVVGGFAYVAAIFLHPEERRVWGIVLIAAAPLANGCAHVPLLPQNRRWLIGTIAFLVTIATAIGWMMWTEPAMVEESW